MRVSSQSAHGGLDRANMTHANRARITIGVTSRSSRSRNVALACMGPRIYIRGIASAMRDTDECESFMYYIRENFGRVAS